MNQFTMPPITPVPFNGIMAFAWVGIFLIIGMLLRATFPAFRKYLIPACIIGGTVGFFFQNFGLLNATGFTLESEMLQVIIWHLFNLTWVYLGLKLPRLKEKGEGASSSKKIIWYAGVLIILSGAASVVGSASSTFTNALGLSSGPDSLGALTGVGFIGGPGQALTVAKVWETATSFTGLPDFALVSAATGYLVAIVVGIFLMNIIARKKNLEVINNPSPSESCGYYDECEEVDSAGNVTTSPSNIDVFAWHIALGLGTYFLALVITVFCLLVFPSAIVPLIWSMFFVICNFTGILVRVFITKIGKKGLLCNGVISRVSNSLVDFLVCGTFISIQVGNIAQYVWPYIISCVVMTFTMGGLCWFYCRKLKEEGPETFVFIFGTVTGSISTGLVLLRMLDPQGKSQVPVYWALCMAVTALPQVLLLAIMNMEVMYNYSVYLLMAAALAVTLAFAGLAYMARIPQTKKAWQDD